MATEARSKYKLNKKQVRRVYEILRLKNTNTSDKSAYLQYRLDVKNRLNAPFQVTDTNGAKLFLTRGRYQIQYMKILC